MPFTFAQKDPPTIFHISIKLSALFKRNRAESFTNKKIISIEEALFRLKYACFLCYPSFSWPRYSCGLIIGNKRIPGI